MKQLTPLNELLRDYLDPSPYNLNRNGHSEQADTLESIIVLASRRYREIMSDIGSQDDRENKDTLCKAIQDDVAWEKRKLL